MGYFLGMHEWAESWSLLAKEAGMGCIDCFVLGFLHFILKPMYCMYKSPDGGYCPGGMLTTRLAKTVGEGRTAGHY